MNKQDRCSLDRRRFLSGMSASAGIAVLQAGIPKMLAAAEEAGERPGVAEVFLDLHRIHKWDESNGDTWDPFWADDDNLYAFNCDGRGFGATGMNLAFNRLSGNTPSHLVGSQINRMDEYGKAGAKMPDNATWKACGQECIDGVFYAFVSRNIYGKDSKDPLLRQLAGNSSLIKSTDRGRTWTRSAQQNYDHPMWPGSSFGAPFFIHYGQNGGQVSKDGATEYTYAVSTNGFWNDGDRLILGRVKRSELPNLDSKDWQYYTGADGSIATNWSSDIGHANPILDRPAKCGQTPICFVPALGVYLLISWYNTATMTKWFEPNEIRYDFYQASRPWGPWEPLNSYSDRFMGPLYHMYGPSLCARFQQAKGADVEISLFTAGCPFDDVAVTPYKLWRIPVLLRTQALPSSSIVRASDPRLHYHGTWFPVTTIEDADIGRLPRATQTRGSSVAFDFDGSGIEYLAQKSKGLGEIDVYVDEIHEDTVSLALPDFPVFLGVTVFSRLSLPRGKHTIKLVSAGDARVNVEGFRVYV